MDSFAIGVDLGGTNLRVAAVDTQGRVMERIATDTEVTHGRDRVLRKICSTIRYLESRFDGSGRLLGIGIGVPGIIDMETGTVHESPNLPGWSDYPLRDEIEQQLGTTVVLENDANAAALGEKWLGAGSQLDGLCMLTLGTGVGGGVVLGGKVWHGMTGMAGELGHMTVDPDGVPCGCGSLGCVEQYASATAIKRMALEALEKSDKNNASRLFSMVAEDPNFSAKNVYELALQGDKAAIAIFHKVGWALGIAVANLVNIFNLPMYVIGGGVANAWDLFAPVMQQQVRKRSFVYVATNPANGLHLDGSTANGQPAPSGFTIVTRSSLGGDAGLIGAARLPMITADKRASAGVAR